MRQPGAQADGKPFIPEDWDSTFKPVLGSFKKYILGRPDQFRIITGAEPGLFTIAVVSNETVVAPSLDMKGKGKKGVVKGKAKGKQWYDSKGGKGKGKGKEKGKAKGWGTKDKAWTDAKPWASALGPAAPATPPDAGGTRKAAPPPTRAVRLLAAAAKEALAEEEEEQAQNEEAAEAEDFWEAGEAAADEEMGEDEWPMPEDEEEAPGAVIEDPIERLWQESLEEPDAAEELKPLAGDSAEGEEEEDAPAERPVHGRFMSLLGGLGVKRPGLAGAAGPSKRKAA